MAAAEVSAWSNEAQCPRVELFKVVGGGRLAWSMGQHGHQRQHSGVGLLRPNLQHGASIERGDHGSAIGSGSSGTWDILGRPCPSNAPGQLLIQRHSNGKVQKVVRLTE